MFLVEMSKGISDPEMMHQRFQNPVLMSAGDDDLRLLLMGNTGSGKSSTGNTIFNDSVFESEMSSSSVTRVSQKHTGSVNNRRVTVIDTPDFIFSTHTDFDSDSELKRALEFCSPGAHVILLILPLSTFTKQEMDFISWFEQKFGAKAHRFTLVLFTHEDKTHKKSLVEQIRENDNLLNLVNRCGQRYHEFNIKDRSNRQQVTELMEKIDRLVSENTNSCYTLEMLPETERRREEEKREREHQMKLETVREQTETRVKKEYEKQLVQEKTKILENQEKTGLFFQQIKRGHFCELLFFSVATGGGSIWRKKSSCGWTIMRGFVTVGSAAAAGVFTGILWRSMLKSQFVCSSSHERPSAVRQLLLKTAGVVCGSSAGAAIGHFIGGNVFPVTVLAGLCGAAGTFTEIH